MDNDLRLVLSTLVHILFDRGVINRAELDVIDALLAALPAPAPPPVAQPINTSQE